MNTIAHQEVEIQRILRQIPPHRLEEAKQLLSLLTKEKTLEGFSSLRGIWEGKGFEAMDDDLEREIRKIRREAEARILTKDI